MKRLLILGILPVLALAQRHERNWRVEDQQTLRRTFDLSAGSGPEKILVDNFSGYIHVTGYDGKQVQMTVQRSTRAESKETLEQANRDIKLDASQQGNAVRLYVDGPFRKRNNHGDDWNGYSVVFDFELQVPRGIELTLKGFNHGNIEVRKVNGDFDIHGFNGGVEMEEIGGAGTIETFNGAVKVAFDRNPERESEFKTFNGSIDVYLLPGLNADLRFKTFHGGIYSDSDIGQLTLAASTGENQHGRFVYRSDGKMSVRAGKGGPELRFDTFNGAIRLHSKPL